VDLTYLTLPVEETFFRMTRHRGAEARLAETAVSGSMLPWAYADAQRTANVMGPRFWSYGLGGDSLLALRTFVRYAWEQGLIRTQPSPEALFAAETREAYVI
jgi:4,5-dihydroxyphthalate decarboxylase